jgi:hypothetical protein
LATILGKETKNCEINATGPLHDLMYSRQGAQYTVEELLYQYDFVAPEQVVSFNRLSGVKALLMPRVIAMSDGEVEKVKAYLSAGGKVLCDALPGDYDELGVKRTANPFAGVPGMTVLGKNFNNTDMELRGKVLDFLESCSAARAVESSTVLENFGREAMHYVSGGADVYAVLRMLGRSEDRNEDEFVFAKKGHLYDVRARRYLGVCDRVKAKVPLHEASVFAVLPQKIESVAIDAPGRVSRGSDFSAKLKVRHASGGGQEKIPGYVLHAELRPPSGKAPFHFKRNLPTQGGSANLFFPIAHNDECGIWKLSVTEALSGISGEYEFTVDQGGER